MICVTRYGATQASRLSGGGPSLPSAPNFIHWAGHRRTPWMKAGDPTGPPISDPGVACGPLG